jgi:hypothetical protein
MPTRKILFIVFTNETCKRNHAFMYALDLERRGYTVRILLEGESTRCLADLEGRFKELFEAAVERKIVAGACGTAARGCSTGDAARDVSTVAACLKVSLLDDMDGHAGIDRYIADGFEIVVF